MTDDYSLGTAEATASVTVADVAPIVNAGPATGTGRFDVVVWGDTVTIADLVAAVQVLVDQGVLTQARGTAWS